MEPVNSGQTKILDLLAVSALALIVRAVTATWTGLTPDEANGIVIATVGSWPDLVQHLKDDGNAPLLYAIMRIAALAVGSGDVAMKLIAISIAVCQVPIAYLILRRCIPRMQSLQVSILLAICPPLVHYSTLIRAYGLMSIFSFLSTWSCSRLLARTGSMKWVAVYGISTALLVYSHYWGGFVAVGQLFLVIIGTGKHWFNLAGIKRWLLGVLLASALFLPWLPSFRYQLVHIMHLWDVPLEPSIAVSELASYVMVGARYSPSAFDQISLLISTALIFYSLLSPANLTTTNFDGRHWKIVAACGYGIGLAYSLFVPVMRDRYLTPFAPILIIAFVSTCYATLIRQKIAVRFLIPLLLWIPIWIPQIQSLASTPDTTTAAIVEQVNRFANRDKDLVVVSWPIISPAINVHLATDIRVISFPDSKRIQFNTWDGIGDRLRDPRILQTLYAAMEKTLAAGGKIWLIDRCRSIEFRDCFDNSTVGDLNYFALEIYRMDQIRTWLNLHSLQLGSNQLAPGRDFPTFLSVYASPPPGSPPRQFKQITPSPNNREEQSSL